MSLDSLSRIKDSYGEHLALNTRAKTQPDFSIVIPALNEELLIERCIEHAVTSVRHAAQDSVANPSIGEILIVDNGSSDNTPKIIEQSGVKLVEQATPGVSYARQMGHESALGKVVIGSDADTTMRLTTAAAHMGHYADDSVDGVIGDYEFDRKVHWLYKSLLRAYAPVKSIKQARRKALGVPESGNFVGANFSYRQVLVSSIGGFELGSNRYEDNILSENMRAAGFNLVVDRSEEAKVDTSSRRMDTFGKSARLIGHMVHHTFREQLTRLPIARGQQFENIRGSVIE